MFLQMKKDFLFWWLWLRFVGDFTFTWCDKCLEQ